MTTFNKYRLKGAYHYQWYQTEAWYKECVDEILRFCKGSTLDVGCGDGFVTRMIANNGYKVNGIDSDPDAILVAKNENVTLHDVNRGVGGDWEYMACLNVIEHLDHPEILKQVITENIHVGAIIITNQYLGGSLGEDHRREYDYQELVDFFKEFNPRGFKLAGGEYIGVKIKL